MHSGPSSNIKFLRRLTQLTVEASNVNIESPRSTRGRSLEGDVFNFSRPATPQSTGQTKPLTKDRFTLPPDQEAQALITSFFSNTGYLFPFMHEETFRSRYKTMRASTAAQAPRSWFGLLNIVFAMAVGTTVDDHLDATQRSQRSNVYYQRALAVCNREVLKCANIDIGECFDFCLASGPRRADRH